MTWSKEQTGRIRSLSFDCYGTLIDWETGIRTALERLVEAGGSLPIDQRAFFDTYLEVEAEVEGQAYRPYREVLTAVQAELARRFGLRVPDDQAGLLAGSVPRWRPFADTNAALARLRSRFRLGVLSNIDRGLFAETVRHLAPEFDGFDFLVAAEDVRSYKPGHGHFDRLLATEVQDRSTHLHVAQSLVHDGVPARELDIPFVWINRRAERNTTRATPIAEFSTVAELADWLGV